MNYRITIPNVEAETHCHFCGKGLRQYDRCVWSATTGLYFCSENCLAATLRGEPRKAEAQLEEMNRLSGLVGCFLVALLFAFLYFIFL